MREHCLPKQEIFFQIRPACEQDIPTLLKIRMASNENRLRNPKDLTEEILVRAFRNGGGVWVADVKGELVGFSWANNTNDSIWALFVHPSFQGHGVGGALLTVAVEWLWSQKKPWRRLACQKIWLDTTQKSQAEFFYQHMGWQRGELKPHGEVRYWLFKKLT